MLLITEHNEDQISCVVENVEGNRKNIFIEGVYMQAEKENKNKRIYPRSVLSSAVDQYITEYVNTGRAGGELNHPTSPVVNPERISHRITELKWDGNNVIGKALVLDTPMGKIVKGLIEGGMKLGVSSRGMGSIESKNGKSYVKNDFRLGTVDVVFDPSAPSAFVNGIMEGVEWVWDNGILKAQEVEKMQTEIRKTSLKNLGKIQEKVFVDFLSKIRLK
jgi:hypothetical protein